MINSLSGNASGEDELRLQQWLGESKDNKILFENLRKSLQEDSDGALGAIDVEAAKQKVLEKYRRIKYRSFVRQGLRYAAIFIIASGLLYMYQDGNLFNGEGSSQTDENAITLQLGDSNIEVLADKASTDKQILNENGEVIGVQRGNQLHYTKNTMAENLVYHQLTVPYGKTFQLYLSDGSEVHLNAGTSLKYPVKFIEGEKRQVFLNGEAYFDVAEDKTHPFVVSADDLNIRVLGTEFNVSSYPEEQDISTVLVEGSVSLYDGDVYAEETASLLEPGYMAKYPKSNNEIAFEKVDVDLHVAWKEGKLIFLETPFREIVKKLERRYDVSIQNNYQELNNVQFTATFTDETFADVLEVFSGYTSFEYKFTGDGDVQINDSK